MTSGVVVQVGQCGNQLGHRFFEAEANSKFFRVGAKGQLIARAVLIDTEPRYVLNFFVTARKISSPMRWFGVWQLRKKTRQSVAV